MPGTGIVKAIGTPSTGSGGFASNNLQTPIGYIFLPKGGTLDIASNVTFKTEIANEISAIILGNFSTFTGESEDMVIQEGSVGSRKKGRDGRVRDSYMIAANLGVLTELSAIDSTDYDVIRILANGQLQGRAYDAEAKTIKGYTTSMIAVGGLTTGSDEAPAGRSILVDYLLAREFNEETVAATANYDVVGIQGISSVIIVDNGDDTVSIAYNNGEPNGDGDINKVYGVEDEFVDGAGAVVATETPANSGIYVLPVAIHTGLTLTSPSVQVDDLKYKCENSIDITVV